MVVDDPFCIAHAAVANLDGVAVEYFSNIIFLYFSLLFIYRALYYGKIETQTYLRIYTYTRIHATNMHKQSLT